MAVVALSTGVRGGRTPLRWRLPNSTPIFVGRELERARLAQLVDIAPVTVVWGLGGLGKTTLVLRVLHERLGTDTSRALFVSLSAADASPHVAVDVARALCAAEGIRTVDWQSLLSDEQALVETAIDLAERGPYTIVIDDLQHGDPESTMSLLRTVNQYARASRWVVTSRIDWPVPELGGQRLQLGTMSEATLTELARRLDTGIGARDLAVMVAHAAGSPWRMRVAVGGAGGAPDSDVLHGLGPEAVELALALAPVEVALRKSVLADLLPDASSSVWAALERRGIVEGRGDGWRLHDMARVLVRERFAARIDAWAERMSELLAAVDDPTARLEALRLSLARKANPRALALLDAHGEDLVTAGYAPELWRLLEPTGDPTLARWRLRGGAELGTPEVLATLSLPSDPSPEDLVVWGRVLFAMGRMQESAEVVKRALTQARLAQDAVVAIDAELLYLHAQTLANLSRKTEMLDMLRTLATGQTELQRRALAAKVYALMGVFETAITEAHRIAPECEDLPVGARLLAYLDLLAIQLSLGRMDDARELAARIERECGDVSMALYNSRYLLVLRTSLATHLGHFQEAHGYLDQVLPFTGRSAVQRPILVSLRLWLRMIEGAFEGIEAQIDQVNREFAGGANEYFTQWGHVLESYHDRARGRSEVPRMEAPPSLTGAGGQLLRIYRLVHRARHGHGPAAADLSALEGIYRESYLWALGRTVPATVAVLAGDHDRAITEAASAEQALLALGNVLYATEATEVLAEALLLAGRLDELARVAGTLERRGRELPSQRLVMLGELYAMAARGALEPALLERVAARPDVSPVACRRARALLGGHAPLDLVDLRVVDAMRRRARVEVVTVTGPQGADLADWVPGWGLDGGRKAAWTPDGRLVAFEEHPVRWACLEAIARSGGAAGREALVPAIWPGERYDPLVHNNRLNPAIRKIRLALEVDPSQPTRLVTTDDGYGFGDAAPVRWMRIVDDG